MATITLRKSKFDGIQGVLDKLKSSFKDYEASLRELKRTAEGVDSSTCSLEDAINDIASSSDKEKEKVEKIKKLNQKIENFVNTAIQREKAARDKIVEKKNDFYKRYKNLKPDCEKGRLERACEKVAKAAKAAWDWVVEHIDIIIAAIIILAAIIICIVCPAAIVAIIGAIACALSAIMGIVDLVCMATHGGKDFATVLAENGHGTLAKIWRGTSIGLDVASIILPVGAGIKMTMEATGLGFKAVVKNGVKAGFKKIGNTLMHPIQSLKNLGGGIKQSFKGFVGTCKENGFLKTIGSKTWNGFKSFTGIDDIENLKNINQIGRVKGDSLIKFNADDWELDKKANCLRPKSQKANDVLSNAEDSFKKLGKDRKFDSIPLTKNKGKLDIDWDAISVDKVGRKDNFSLKQLTGDSTSWRREVYGKKDSQVNMLLNKRNGVTDVRSPDYVRYTGSSGKYSTAGFTAHENFNMVRENIVPTSIHETASGITHVGGISNRKGTLKRALAMQDLGMIDTFRRQALFGTTHLGVDSLQSVVGAN